MAASAAKTKKAAFEVLDRLRKNPDDPTALAEFETLNGLYREADTAFARLESAKEQMKEYQEEIGIAELRKEKKEADLRLMTALRGLLKPTPLFDNLESEKVA